MTATGGALVLHTLLGRQGWLRAMFLQGGSGRALTLGIVTVPTSDRLVVAWINVATVGCIQQLTKYHPTVISFAANEHTCTEHQGQGHSYATEERCPDTCLVVTVPLGVSMLTLLALVKGMKHTPAECGLTPHPCSSVPLPYIAPVIHPSISCPRSPGSVCGQAALVGCQGGWASMAPGSDWSRNPWGRLPASSPAAKPQLPERQKRSDRDVTMERKPLTNKNNKKNNNKDAPKATTEI